MATIYRRIQFLELSFSNEDKLKIGRAVCDWYFADKSRPKIGKVTSVEPEGECKALSYPKKFHPQIDDIIKSFAPNKRKRITVGKIKIDP